MKERGIKLTILKRLWLYLEPVMCCLQNNLKMLVCKYTRVLDVWKKTKQYLAHNQEVTNRQTKLHITLCLV